MSLRPSTSFHSSNVSNFDNHIEEVDFDFFDYNTANNYGIDNANTQNCELSSPCTPTKFVTEVIIETQRSLYSSQDKIFKEEEINSNVLPNSNDEFNSHKLEDTHSSDCDLSLVNCIAYADEYGDCKFENDTDSFESLSESTNTSDLTIVTPMSSSNSSLNMYKQNMSVDQTEEKCFINKMERDDIAETRLESNTSEENELASLTKSLETLSIPGSSNCSRLMSSFSGKLKPKRKSMTFTNEQLRKINRDNDILLKKIMAHAKPRPKQTSTVHNFHPTRTSAAINRLRQQKQIEHDNYVLLNKIRDVRQTRKSIFDTGFTT